MYTYIIVDDEDLARTGTMKKLDSLKDTIQCIGQASNGIEALSLIEERNPDVIITDMQMPLMDGTQLLEEMSKRYPNKRFIVISGYKDFDYVKHALNANAVDYIVKPFSKEDIKKSMLSALDSIEHTQNLHHQIEMKESEKEQTRYAYDIQVLNNLILGYHTSSTTLTSKRLHFINETHNLIIITLYSTTAIDSKQIEQFLFENGFGDLALFLQHSKTAHLGHIILFTPQNSPIHPIDYCKQISKSILNDFRSESTLLFGISSLHSDLSDLHTAFLETVDSLNSRKATDKNCIYIHTTLPTVPQNTYYWNDLETFLFRLESGDSESVKSFLHSLFQQFNKTTDLSINDIKCYCLHLLELTRSMLYHYFDQTNSSPISSSVQNALNTMYCLPSIEEYFTHYFTNISNLLKEKSVYSIEDSIAKIKIYVERNYQKDLNIEFISSLFYMSRSYCSHLFHKSTGVKLVDYINDIRIHHAKLLLRDSNKKMYQISTNIGYDNVKYFFRIFKKRTGLTPEQYRSTHQKSV